MELRRLSRDDSPLADVLKTHDWAHPRVSAQDVRVERGIYISGKSPGEADDAGQGTTLWEPPLSSSWAFPPGSAGFLRLWSRWNHLATRPDLVPAHWAILFLLKSSLCRQRVSARPATLPPLINESPAALEPSGDAGMQLLPSEPCIWGREIRGLFRKPPGWRLGGAGRSYRSIYWDILNAWRDAEGLGWQVSAIMNPESHTTCSQKWGLKEKLSTELPSPGCLWVLKTKNGFPR